MHALLHKMYTHAIASRASLHLTSLELACLVEAMAGCSSKTACQNLSTQHGHRKLHVLQSLSPRRVSPTLFTATLRERESV